MNKQEAIEEIKNLEGLTILDKTINFDSKMIPKKEVLNIVNQIDGPEKTVVPQYVADFYESIKDDFEDGVYELCAEFYEEESELSTELYWWFKLDVNKPIETLVKMKLYGYEVEKEQMYTVEIPNPNRVTEPIIYLSRGEEGKIFLNSWFVYESKNWKNQPYAQLTESEIKEDFEWAWQFAEEVKE